MRKTSIAVDATRSRSGGAVAHMLGILNSADPRDFGIDQVHLWAHPALIDQVGAHPWLVRRCPNPPGTNLAGELHWQYAILPRLLVEQNCSILFNTDAGTVCPSRGAITLSQDMLCFEPRELDRYALGRARLRLEALKRVQAISLRRADVVIFLTDYARTRIQESIGRINRSVVIPHGVEPRFAEAQRQRRPFPSEGPLEILYVSNTAPYKHQWHVVAAIAALRKTGLNLALRLVGGGRGAAQKRLEAAIKEHDPDHVFVRQDPFIPNAQIPNALAAADIFVFASTCENMPVTLLEAMASSIPICSSRSGPMPEILDDGGLYFDAENPASIAAALRECIRDDVGRTTRVRAARLRADKFTWERSARATWETIASRVLAAQERSL